MPRFARLMRLATAVFSISFVAAPAAAQSANQALRAALGGCGEPCVIRYSPGGDVALFQAAAKAVRAGARRRVIIDGPCLSACAIFADMVRSRVCITSRASFGFHKASVFAVHTSSDGTGQKLRLVAREDPPQSRDISNWVRRNGGFPTRGMRTMSNRQAARFFRRCT